MKGFVKCPNGHMYKETLESCPYCQAASRDFTTGATDGKSEVARTQLIRPMDGAAKTEVIGSSQETPQSPYENVNDAPYQSTHYENEIIEQDESGHETVRREVRRGSRLVGWLVTYTLDPLGVAFDIREGKNFIGKEFSCSINVADPMVSGVHAVILYRNGKIWIKDNMSSNGTFVNGEDIEAQQYELHDGDTIQVGDTTLKLRTAL